MISLTDKILLFASWKMGQQHFQTCCALNGSEENKRKREYCLFTKRNYYSSGSSEVLFVNSNQNEE
jgi:hypothetical protein